jgi:hypothetical protein
VKRYGKFGRKVGSIMKWFGKYGKKVNWNVKWYGKHGRKASRIVIILPSCLSWVISPLSM